MDKSQKKRSGQLRRQIPAFGNWDSLNDDMPITQYFESARQAGLTRFSSSSDDFSSAANSSGDLYAAAAAVVTKEKKKGKGGEKRGPPQTKEAARGGGRQAVKVYDYPNPQNGVVGFHHPPRGTRRAPKAVDEDLYKIPPELLRRTDRKKRFGFISSCLVLPCTA